MRQNWEIPALLISIGWSAALLLLAIATAPWEPPPQPLLPTVEWVSLATEVPGPTSEVRRDASEGSPGSQSHPSRMLMGQVPVRITNPSPDPLIIRYRAASGGDAANGTEHRRTIPPGVDQIELPFYVDWRLDELRKELVTLTLLPAEGLTLPHADDVHTVTFLPREPGIIRINVAPETFREYSNEAVEFSIVREIPAEEQAIQIPLRFTGTAFDDKSFSSPPAVAVIPPGKSESDPVRIVHQKRMGTNRFMRIEAGGQAREVQCIAAVDPNYELEFATKSAGRRQLKEGERLAFVVRRKGPFVPGLAGQCVVTVDKGLMVDSAEGTFTKENDALTFHVTAETDNIAFEPVADARIRATVDGKSMEHSLQVLDATQASVAVTGPQEPTVIRRGAAEPAVWTVTLQDQEGQPVVPANSFALPFQIEASSLAMEELRVTPAATLSKNLLTGVISLAANRSSATLSILAPLTNSNEPAEKDYRLSFTDRPGIPWRAAPPARRQFSFRVEEQRFPYSPLKGLSVAEGGEATLQEILSVDAQRSRPSEIQFRVAPTSTASPDDYIIDLKSRNGLYSLPVQPGDKVVKLPIRAIADGLPEKPESLKLTFPAASFSEPLSIDIRDGDQSGDVLVLVVANPAMEDELNGTTRLEQEIREIQKLKIQDFAAGAIFVVDKSDAFVRPVPSERMPEGIRFFNAEDNERSLPLEKTLSAWKTLTDARPQIQRVLIVWASDGKARPGQKVGWANRPRTAMTLIWLGGTSGQDFYSSQLLDEKAIGDHINRQDKATQSAQVIKTLLTPMP